MNSWEALKLAELRVVVENSPELNETQRLAIQSKLDEIQAIWQSR